MGMAAIFGHVTKFILINFHFLVPKNFRMKFGYKWPSSFWEKQVLCLCWGFTAQSTQWGHVERGQFT